MAGVLVLGGGVTGLAAARAAGPTATVLEAGATPGGLCATYHRTPAGERLASPPADGEAYRFEVGGGHWLFGGDAETVAAIEALVPCRTHRRRSSVRLADGTSVGFPLQHHLAALDDEVRDRALAELLGGDADHAAGDGPSTMADWVRDRMGPTLAGLFFDSFHERYTAGLYRRIAPQDPDKSPVDRAAVLAGAGGSGPGDDGAAGAAHYNETFRYPVDGLDALVRALTDGVDVRTGSRVVAIDHHTKVVHTDDGADHPYDRLVSTLPLPVAVDLAGVTVDAPPDPHTSVLVVNLGAEPGPGLGTDHWVYDATAHSGFHRYGVYSNVDEAFLPRSARSRSAGEAAPSAARRASLYVERAYPGGRRPSPAEEDQHVRAMVAELQERDVVGEVEVVDPTWIETAYTWSWPGSMWRTEALAALAAVGVHQAGRYGRWRFQGIAASLAEGRAAGRAAAGAVTT
ncbi:MAG: FAD-dependent oxidoreductase [Acidimicrobiales bacterium]